MKKTKQERNDLYPGEKKYDTQITLKHISAQSDKHPIKTMVATDNSVNKGLPVSGLRGPGLLPLPLQDSGPNDSTS